MKHPINLYFFIIQFLKERLGMKNSIKIFLISAIIIGGISGILYYTFTQIDFIGHKYPKVVAENVKRLDKTLLSAEYRNGKEYCIVNILDSVKIQIIVGDNASLMVLDKKYKSSGDTLFVVGGNKGADKYINSDQFLIHNNKLLYKTDSHGHFDTIHAMKIKFNKIKR